MATCMLKTHPRTVSGAHANAGRVLVAHPQAIPTLRGNESAWSQLNNHDDTLARRLVTPNTAAPEHSQTWTNPCHFDIQNVPHVQSLPDSPPIFYAPFPDRLWNHADALPYFPPEMGNHQFTTPNDRPFMYPIQTPSIRTNPCARPIDYSSSTNPNAEYRYQALPHVTANASTMLGSSSSVSIGAPQMHLDSIIPTYTQPSPPTHLQPPHLPRESPLLSEARRFRPGKEPAAEFEPNPVKLHDSCERDGGDPFAVAWTLVVFSRGVTKEALVRTLDRAEIGRMESASASGFPGGFEPRQAYDGFISKIGDRYECGLCREGKRTCWKNKKDAPRHLRKFHFGLGDLCGSCGRSVYSNGEMNSHRCVPVA